MSVREQVEDVRTELGDASARLARLAARATDEQWTRRPPGNGWSAAECVAHLTITTEHYLPLLEAARASMKPGLLPTKYKMGFAGGLLWWILRPPAKRYSRSRTGAAFVPQAAAPKAATVDAFERSQRALHEWIGIAAHLPMNTAMITSPFNEKMKYNAYAALRVLAVHQRRHLWQAERALNGVP